MINKWTTSLLIALASFGFSLEAYPVLDQAEPMVKASWSLELSPDHAIFESDTPIDNTDTRAAFNRFTQLLSFPFLNQEQVAESFTRVHSFAQKMPQVVDYLDRWLEDRWGKGNEIVNISIYGSYLYSIAIPDDIDMVVIVDTPYEFYSHIDVDAAEVLDEELPTLSFTLIDLGTIEKARQWHLADKGQDLINRRLKISAQKLTRGSNWYYGLYGKNFRNVRSPGQHPPVKNHLFDGLALLKAAGDRLYGHVYAFLSPESEPCRLRKVTSRILATDFFLHAIGADVQVDSAAYLEQYRALRETDPDDEEAWAEWQDKIDAMYRDRLFKLLQIAQREGLYDELNIRIP